MPQLDIVTLFSQVFWLISLYFLAFFFVLRYCLPRFSKLFKLRVFFILKKSMLLNKNNLDFSKNIEVILNKVQISLNSILRTNSNFFLDKVNFFNLNTLASVNILFIKIYNYNLLKYNLYKKFFI